jgi:SNF2 family DNA or RNA helicase
VPVSIASVVRGLLTPDLLHGYQQAAVLHLHANPESMLWLDMGLGKTIITLTAFVQLREAGLCGPLLIMAPLRPARVVWEREARKWSHTKHLRFSYLLGTAKQREQALFLPADVYVVNYENLQWLTDIIGKHYLVKDLSHLRVGKTLPFGWEVFDEITMMKNSGSKRSKAWRKVSRHISRHTGLTGTPASNGLADLFGQYLMVDGGRRLGPSKSEFTSAYFQQAGPYRFEVRDFAWDVVHRRIADITLQMSAADYLTLPPVTVNDVYVDLNGSRQPYETLEKQLFVELDNGVELEVFSAAALQNKLLQFCNGATYHDPEQRDSWAHIHDAKLDALEEILKETGDKPILLAYQFRHDWARIQQRFPDAETLSGASATRTMEILDRFYAGDLRLLCGHPKSMGHGIDGIQDVCQNVVWFGLNWNLEWVLQTNARVDRQGQKQSVVIHRILVADTIDEAVKLAIEGKAQTQDDLRAAVAEYRKQKETA